jgi:hypothetical protein
LLPGRYSKGEAACADVGGRRLGEDGDESIHDGGADVGGGALDPFLCEAETALAPCGFVFVVFVFAVRVIDGVVVVAVAAGSYALLDVECVGVVLVGQCAVVTLTGNLILLHGIPSIP